MGEKLEHYKNQAQETWSHFSKKQKWSIIGAFLFLLISLGLLIYWAQTTNYEPIYTNLSPAEAGEIVASIEAEGIPVDVSDDGTVVSVPSSEASRLKVELAHEGIPRSGNINYSVFSENMGLGMTDDQFEVIERDAMQNEIRYLIEHIDGIDQAQVMISTPEESVWVADEQETASASVVLTTRTGLNLDQEQVNGLYHLIGRSVPNLPVENIEIMDHNWQTLHRVDEEIMDTTLSNHQQQRQVRQDIENDIQRELQQMLGTIIGMDNVVVSVFANVDFTQENREEQLVEPVDEETMEGIDISIEEIQETYEGEGAPAGGDVGTGEDDIAGYQGVQGTGDTQSEIIEERINRDVNRIYRQMEMSPYQVEDLTVNVGVQPPDPEDPDSLLPETIEQIEDVLFAVVGTALSTSEIDWEEEELEQKISVFASPFEETAVVHQEEPETSTNALLYSLGAALIAAVGGLVYMWVRSRRNRELEQDEAIDAPVYDEPEEELLVSDENTTKRQMEKLAKEKPDEFAKLLKSWLSDE